jgi:RNA polymerase sigma-70 factor (ECF subfamily)
MSSAENELALVAEAKRGDRAALERLLLTHSAVLSRYIAQRLLPSMKEAVSVDDVLQETLLHAFLGIGQFEARSPGSFFPWLKAIADVRLLDALKAQRRKKRGGNCRRLHYATDGDASRLVDLIDQLPGNISTASRRMARSEAMAAVHVGIASLPADQREAIRLHLLAGKSLEETALAMHRTKDSIRALIHRGKQKLAEAMGRASIWLSSG